MCPQHWIKHKAAINYCKNWLRTDYDSCPDNGCVQTVNISQESSFSRNHYSRVRVHMTNIEGQILKFPINRWRQSGICWIQPYRKRKENGTISRSTNLNAIFKTFFLLFVAVKYMLDSARLRKIPCSIAHWGNWKFSWAIISSKCSAQMGN